MRPASRSARSFAFNASSRSSSTCASPPFTRKNCDGLGRSSRRLASRCSSSSARGALCSARTSSTVCSRAMPATVSASSTPAARKPLRFARQRGQRGSEAWNHAAKRVSGSSRVSSHVNQHTTVRNAAVSPAAENSAI
jgi:hypothetical protein